MDEKKTTGVSEVRLDSDEEENKDEEVPTPANIGAESAKESPLAARKEITPELSVAAITSKTKVAAPSLKDDVSKIQIFIL